MVYELSVLNENAVLLFSVLTLLWHKVWIPPRDNLLSWRMTQKQSGLHQQNLELTRDTLTLKFGSNHLYFDKWR